MEINYRKTNFVGISAQRPYRESQANQVLESVALATGLDCLANRLKIKRSLIVDASSQMDCPPIISISRLFFYLLGFCISNTFSPVRARFFCVRSRECRRIAFYKVVIGTMANVLERVLEFRPHSVPTCGALYRRPKNKRKDFFAKNDRE